MRRLLILLALLISYGSLYPFGFRPDDASWAEFVDFATNLSIITNRGDILANVLLFTPVGFVAALAAERDQKRTTPLWLSSFAAILLAVGLQLAQIWIPGRDPSMGDAMINAMGLIIGILAAILVRRLPIRPAFRVHQHATLIPFTLALLWVGYRWFPGVPTLDIQNVRNALKPLLLRPEFDTTRILANTTGWLAWMLILLRARIGGIGVRPIALAAIAVLLLQPFFIYNTISVNNVAGLAIALALLPLLRHPEAPTAVCLLLFSSILTSGLHPYTITPYPNTFHWLPFAGYLDGSMESNAMNLIYKSFFYGTLVYLMHLNGTSWRGAAITTAIWLGIIETLQIWFVSRTAEITDPLLALLIAYAMSQIERYDKGNNHHYQPTNRLFMGAKEKATRKDSA